MTVFFQPLLPAAADLLAQPPAFVLAASSNITASGAATTQQLTAGSGTFTAGRIQDDENPTDAIDIVANGYTELEWCIEATADTVAADDYEFRVVLADGTPLDTYTQTPAWEIGGGATAITGTTSFAFAASGALTGTGALTGATTATFGSNAALTGTGALTGALAVTFSPSGTLSGTAALVGATSFAFTAAGTLTGTAALAGSTTVTFGASGALTGSGALAGTSAAAFAASGALTGSGALVGSSAATFSPSGTLTNGSSSDLSGSVAMTFSPSGTLSGTGALVGSTALAFAPSGALTGTGALAGSSALAFSPSGAMTGSGALAGTSALAFTVSGSLTEAPADKLNGFAAMTFTASGVLQSPTDADDTGPTPAGKGRRRRRRYFVEIDGERFFVESAEEAAALLVQARALAETAAQTAAAAIVKARTPRARSLGKVKPVALRPRIKTDAPQTPELQAAKSAIQAIYDDAARIAELQLLMERQAAADDEAEIEDLIAIGAL